MKRLGILLSFVPLLLVALPGAAQERRSQLLDSARVEFDQSAALDLLVQAADPTVAPPDSVWAMSVYDLALMLTGVGRDELAEVWLRWVSRHGSEWPIDPSWYPPAFVEIAEEEASEVGGGLGGWVRTTWTWPEDFDPDARGQVRVEARPDVPVTVSVAGADASGQTTLELDPGTYRLVLAAPGHETVEVTREILPGASTVLALELIPSLPASVLESAARGVVRLRYDAGATPVCVDGVVHRNGMVITALDALPSTSGIRAVAPSGTTAEVSLLASDPASNVAIFDGDVGVDALDVARGGEAGQNVWSVHHAGCGSPGSEGTRLATWPSGGTERAALVRGLPEDALGSALVDRSGSVLGVVVGAERVVPMSRATELLRVAVAERTGAMTPDSEQVASGGSGGGGFPIVWVGAGAAAIGLGVALLGGGGNGGGEPRPTGIRITLPGGGP